MPVNPYKSSASDRFGVYIAVYAGCFVAGNAISTVTSLLRKLSVSYVAIAFALKAAKDYASDRDTGKVIKTLGEGGAAILATKLATKILIALPSAVISHALFIVGAATAICGPLYEAYNYMHAKQEDTNSLPSNENSEKSSTL